MKVFSLPKLSFHFSDYEKLFKTLGMLLGGVGVRCSIVRDIILEARRFKKKLLVKMLEEFQMNLF